MLPCFIEARINFPPMPKILYEILVMIYVGGDIVWCSCSVCLLNCFIKLLVYHMLFNPSFLTPKFEHLVVIYVLCPSKGITISSSMPTQNKHHTNTTSRHSLHTLYINCSLHDFFIGYFSIYSF